MLIFSFVAAALSKKLIDLACFKSYGHIFEENNYISFGVYKNLKMFLFKSRL